MLHKEINVKTTVICSPATELAKQGWKTGISIPQWGGPSEAPGFLSPPVLFGSLIFKTY